MTFDFTVKEFILGGGTGTSTFEFYRRGFNLGGSGSQPSWKDIILHGNTALTLVNSKANGLNYLKLFGGCEQRNLPVGYTEYDGLIESDGLAYINLDCSLTQDDEIELEFTKASNVASRDIFGGRSSASSNNISVILAGSGNIVEDFNNSDYTDYRLNVAISLNTRYKVVMNKTGRYLYQGDTLVASNTTACNDTITTVGCYLFNLAGTGLGNKFIGTIHRCLIKGKRDVVPAGNGTEYGMYDKLNDVFYPNANTEGSFTVGSAVVPTPDYPVDIVCNNGKLKFGKPIIIDETRNYAYINTTGSWAWSSDSYSIALPVTVGKKYRIIISSTDSSVVGAIFRYGFTDSDPEEFKQSEVTPSPTSISTYDFWRGTPQDLSDVEVTATHPYLIIQFAAAYASTVVSTYLTVKDQTVYTDGTTETVNVHGVNIFNKNDTENIGSWYSGSNQTITQTKTNETLVMRAKPNTTYYFKHCSVKGGCRAFYTEVEDWGVGSPCSNMSGNAVGNANTVYSITTSANAKWIFFNYGRSNLDASVDDQRNDFMVSTSELTSDTPYENYYNGGSATAEMLLKIGTYKDVQEVLTGAVTRNVGVYVFDGTETLGIANATFIAQIRDKILSKTPLWCSHFEYSTKTSSQVEDFKIISFASRNIGFRYDACDNKTAFSNWLKSQYENETPVIVVYPLAESTTESVTPQSLNIQAGTNIVEISQASIDGLELEVKYKAGVTVTIEEIEDAQLSNDVTVTIS